MLVVFAGDCLVEALEEENGEVLRTLIAKCDRIAMTEAMMSHHQKTLKLNFNRREIPVLAELEDNFRPPKVANPRRRTQVGEVPGLRSQHEVIFKEALAIGADYLITNRQAWINLGPQLPQQHALRIVTPSQYVAERSRIS